VGLPDTAVRESRERVRAALSTCGVTWGEQRLTVNLSPADLRKTGTGLDLALALAVLGARGRLGRSAAGLLGRTVYIGELGLDGSVHSVRGVLPSVQAAVAAGVEEIVVAQEAAAEAELVPGARVTAISHIGQLVERYGGRLNAAVAAAVEQISEAGREAPPIAPQDDEPPDLVDVVGLSVYPQLHPLGTAADRVLTTLDTAFPASRIAVTELGYGGEDLNNGPWWFGSATDPSVARTAVAEYVPGAALGRSDAWGAPFWWYYLEDQVGTPGGQVAPALAAASNGF